MELTSLDIKEPGLRSLPPGVERYIVVGGGLSVFEVFPEDQIEIINNEGKQLLEIAFILAIYSSPIFLKLSLS